MSLEDYIDRFRRLRVNKVGDHESPHKPSMLLAVIGLAETGRLHENRIEYMPPLLDRYLEIFKIVRTGVDTPNPHLPFFFLRGDSFWHLKAVSGHEAVLNAMNGVGGPGAVLEHIDYAYLDEELHQHMLDSEAREMLRQILVTRWFGNKTQELDRLKREDQYERTLRDVRPAMVRERPLKIYERAARDTAFRRVVTEAYDYRCAASGLRVILPDDAVMVQAAHLIPFSEAQDDDPGNGIALTPDYHWALDRNIIAPGPDMKWHVSRLLDERIKDNHVLLRLEGEELILPKDKRFKPRRDALEYRMDRLKK